MPRPSPISAPYKGKPGPRPHQPTEGTRQLVKVAVAAGMTQDAIAQSFGISAATLRNHYPDEINGGAQEIERAIAGTLASIALDRNHPKSATCGIFWLKTRYPQRWAEAPTTGVTINAPGGATGQADGPMRFTIAIGDARPARLIDAEPD